jgi:hypothetical protein
MSETEAALAKFKQVVLEDQGNDGASDSTVTTDPVRVKLVLEGNTSGTAVPDPMQV